MTLQQLHWPSLLTAGLVSGLVQVAAGITLYMAGLYFELWTGPLGLALLAAGIAGGTRWYVKRTLGGRSTYLTALVVGICIAVCTALVYATYNVVSVSFVYADFFGQMANAELARQQESGGPAAESLESLRARLTLATIVANNVRAFCIVGTVMSAVFALITRGSSRGPRQATV